MEGITSEFLKLTRLTPVSNRGNYDAQMKTSDRAKQEITWWITNMNSTFRHIRQQPPSVELKTDASDKGWGAFLDGKIAQSSWTMNERSKSINVRELLGTLFGLKAFFS